MIDCHAHVLPNVDDGPETVEQSHSILETAYRFGTKIIYATTHQMPGGMYLPNQKVIQSSIVDLNHWLKKKKYDLKIKIASELMIRSETYAFICNRRYINFEDTNYILVEFDPRTIHQHYVEDCLDELETQGNRIIIAHPERYFDLSPIHEKFLERWMSRGFYFQINRTSILGLHGKVAQKWAYRLIDYGWAHLISSDAHDAQKNRVSRLDDVKEVITKRYGKKKSKVLLEDNPLRLSQNLSLKNMQKIGIIRHLINWIYFN